MAALDFTDKQRKVIAAALVALAVAFLAGLAMGGLYVLRLFLGFFSGVLAPIAAAALLELTVRPYFLWLVPRTPNRTIAALIVCASVLLPLLAAVIYVSMMVAHEVGNLIATLPDAIETLRIKIADRIPALAEYWREHDLSNRAREFLRANGEQIANNMLSFGTDMLALGGRIFQSFLGVMGWIVLPVYFFFLLVLPEATRADVGRMLQFLPPARRQVVVDLGAEFVGLLVTFFRGQFIVCVAMGVLYAVGFSMIGLRQGLLIGLVMGFLNIVPYLGSTIGLAISLPTALWQAGGGWDLLGETLAVIVAVQTTEGYVLTPHIMGGRTGLHPMAIIFGVLFWGTAFGGIPGMIFAIPLTAFVVVAWRRLVSDGYKEECGTCPENKS